MAGENVNRRLNIYINGREVTNTLTAVTREMRKVENQMRGLNEGSENYQEDLERLGNEYRELEKAQRRFREDIAGVRRGFEDVTEAAEDTRAAVQETALEMDAAGNSFSDIWEGLKTGNMKQAQEGLMGIRSGLAESAKAGMAFIATPIGAAVAALVAIGAGAKALWDYNAGLMDMNNKLSSLGVSSESLSTVRSQIQATAETFDKEFDEIAEKANSLSKTYSISMTEANDIIAQGLANGGAQNENFLDSLGEYDEFFAKAGYSAKQFVDVINTGYDLGIYDDKLPDALKEADLSLKEQTKSTRDALINAFGASFTDDILKKVRTGEMTTKEALEAIAVKSQEVGLSQQQQAQLTADVFRGAGEDAGGAQKILDAVAASTKRNMSESAKATDELRLANERLNEAQAALFEIDGFGDMWTKMKTAGIDAFSTFLEYIAEVKGDLQPLIDLVSIIFANAWETVKFTFTQAFEIVGGTLKVVGTLIKTWVDVFKKLFEGDVSGAIRVGTEGFVNMGKVVANVFIGLKNNVLNTLSNIVENIAPILETLGLDVDKIKKKLEGWKSQKFVIKGEVKVDDPKNPSGGSSERTITKDSGNADEKAEALKRAEAAKKAAEERKKLLEQQAKELESINKELLATQRSFQDAQLDLMADGYEKEKAKINLEYDRKIEDLKSHLVKESELKELQKQIDNARASGNNNEAARLQEILSKKLEINKAYNDSIVVAEQSRNLKLGSLQEKYLNEEFAKEQKAHERALMNLQTKQNFELAGVTSFKDAKAILSQTMSADELKEIKTLEQAKKAIKEQNLKEEYELQKAHFEKIIAQYRSLLELDMSLGGTLFTEEERDNILNNLDQVKNKLSTLVANKPEDETGKTSREEGMKALSGIDILGFSPEQWDNVFGSLDTVSEKMAAMQTVVGGLQNAFGMYFQFLEAGEQRSLQKFQKSIDSRKKEQADLLAKGYITQEVYNARVEKLDSELDKKKAEIEYKQAKRQKAMQVATIIMNTAQAIMGIWAQFPKADFGVTAAIMTGVVAGIGAAQLGLILAQPLPEKGFKTGGYTGRGNTSEVAGLVHKDEYVIPSEVLYDNDPAMPSIMSYVEGKRTGKIRPGDTSEVSNPLAATGSKSNDDLIIWIGKVIEKNTAILEKLNVEGIMAWLEVDLPTAKKIRKKIQELEIIEKQGRKA